MNDTRECIDLTGIWRTRAEGDNFGIGCEQNEGNRWREVTIPSTFEHCLPEHIGFIGTCWFKKCVFVPHSMQHKRVVLSFQAVNYHATVWVNGRFAGSSDEGFLPFDILVSGLLKYDEENIITVRVNNETAAGELPPVHFWRSQGGIIRKVELVATDLVYIQNIKIAAHPQGTDGSLKAIVSLQNELATAVQVKIIAKVTACGTQDVLLSIDKTIELDTNAITNVELEDILPNVNTWSPDAPFLYNASFELSVEDRGVDCQQSKFGFRTICVQDGKVLLNGNPIFFNGFNRHEDYPDTKIAIDAAVARRDLEDIKKSGANFVRMCHYPHDSAELDLCDEIGLLVMDEIPLCALLVSIRGINLEDAKHAMGLSLDHAKAQLRRLIERDYNHPSVIFWSVSNETNEQEPGVTEINNTLMRLAKALDPSRLTMHVSMPPYWTSDLASKLFIYDDVICLNEYTPQYERLGKHNWDYGMADAAQYWAYHSARLAALYPGKPMMITEFGYQTGHWHDGIEDEEMQAKMISIDYAGMKPYVCGALVWCYADHAWPLLWPSRFPVFGRDISIYGVVTRSRCKKRAYEVYKSIIKS